MGPAQASSVAGAQPGDHRAHYANSTGSARQPQSGWYLCSRATRERLTSSWFVMGHLHRSMQRRWCHSLAAHPIASPDSSSLLGGGPAWMGRPYADDLRHATVRLIEDGHTREEAAQLCGVSLSSIGRFIRRFRTSGSLSPHKFGGCKGFALAKHAERIKRWGHGCARSSARCSAGGSARAA